MAWGSLQGKVTVVGGMFLSYDYKLDALWIGGLLVVAAAAVVLSRSIAIEPAFAALTVAFALLYLLLPHSLITATNVDARVVPAAVAFFLCAIRLSLAPRVAALLAVCVVLLAGSRVVVIERQWHDISNKIAVQVQLLDAALPRDANLYSLFPEGGAQIAKTGAPVRSPCELCDAEPKCARLAHVRRALTAAPRVARGRDRSVELGRAVHGQPGDPQAILVRLDVQAARRSCAGNCRAGAPRSTTPTASICAGAPATAAADLDSVPGAEVGGDDRHRQAAVDARRVVQVHRGDPELAPLRIEDVRPVLRRGHPERDRPRGRQARRRPEDVLADRPGAGTRSSRTSWSTRFQNGVPSCELWSK